MDLNWFEDMEKRIPVGGVRTRFAPSPTGYMHVGNLRTALYAWLIARSMGGTFIVRIEDTDQSRLVPGAVDVIFKTLKECGLEHDEGPDVGGPVGPYVQTQRREYYRKYAELLMEKGGAYRCFCGKDEQEDSRPQEDGAPARKYDGRCSRLTQAEIEERLKAGQPYVIRQKIPREGSTTFSDVIFGDITVENDSLDDNVLIKSDGLPTYNFANVIDDHLMGITHVVRGSEYLSSAPKYNLLYRSFGWDIPKYIHVSPVMRDAQHKLSKRHGDPTYEDLIAEGYLSEAIVNYVALLGWSPGGERELYTLKELTEVFNLRGLSKSPAIFDKAKLTHFNGEYIRALSPEAFHSAALPYIERVASGMDTRLIASLLQPRCEKLSDIPGQIDFLAALPEYDAELFENKKAKTDKRIALDMLRSVLPVFGGIESWRREEIHEALMGHAAALGVKNALLLWPVRIAVSGRSVTPGGADEICALLGREETLRRVGLGITKLEASV